MRVRLVENRSHLLCQLGLPERLVEHALDQTSRVSLLFTDVVLPCGMGGPMLAEEVKRRRPGLSTLFMSGYSDDTIIHQGRLDEGVELLNKPFRKADLAQKVRSVLDKANS